MRRRTILTGAGVVLANAMSDRASRAAAPPRTTVIIEAGAFDRVRTPVTFTVPASLAGRPLGLRDSRGRQLSLQVDAAGDATFILPALRRGRRAVFRLIESAAGGRSPLHPAAGVKVARDANGLIFTVDRISALGYRSRGAFPRADIPEPFLRGGYLHPVHTPAGRLVTDDYPPKHIHHHGIWTSWSAVEHQGRKPDFWNMGKKTGRSDFVSMGEVWEGPVAGGFSSRHAHVDLLADPPRAALEEDWRVTLYRTHDRAPPYFLFDVEIVQRAAERAPVVLAQYLYGGLGLRGHRAWDGKDNAWFLTSEGKDRATGNETRGRWVHMEGLVDGRPAGLAVLIHPGNLRAPQPLRLHPTEPFLSVAPCQVGPFTIAPGTPYVARYRFVVSDGAVDPKRLERLWNDYAKPPVVNV
jgi:hypothetical protein